MSENITWNNVTGQGQPIEYGLVVDSDYRFYYLGIAKILFLGIIPLGSLIYLNWKIYKGVKCPPTLSEEQKELKSAQKRERKMAKVFIGIVTVFIVCHTFRVIIEIDDMTDSDMLVICYKAGKDVFSLWSYIVDPIREFMMVLNSSLNMVIYFCVDKKFRKYLITRKETISRRISRNQPISV